MALAPSLSHFVVVGKADAPHTLDIFLDYVCPFSAKIANGGIESVLRPLLSKGGKYDGKVKVIARLQVQPWHGSSLYTHEAALAVARIKPEAYWPYSLALFKHQEEYYDKPTLDLSPTQVRQKLAALAAESLGNAGWSDAATTEFINLVTPQSTNNGGVAVTEDLKYTIKFSRQNSIHVSPTVLWDGIVANEVSSGWGEKEWSEFLEKKVTV
ncbi:hypothetical protein CYLTODRAFT_419853 [Cylindrobasidium torrendii FP15055 ss-10]|uniref:Thioredoxin-like fold domain-containing protein n=1 Tax=Cylindrobasidium torrendii FP15055 ss-10 TaxID=1314674 RepID=A0A0D7BIJ9_9AGAR|nr:hypothetical protein CYLTODRAFT_419853 [Cylindrobasidium torrendii FP15055 ss-10]